MVDNDNAVIERAAIKAVFIVKSAENILGSRVTFQMQLGIAAEIGISG